AVPLLLICGLAGLMRVSYSSALYIYSHIPDALGGGKAVIARVILNDKGVEFWRQAGVSDDPTREIRSRTVKILYSDEKLLIVKAFNQRSDPNLNDVKTMILNRELVDAIVTGASKRDE